MSTSQELEQKLAELILKYDVPGAQLAVLDGDSVTEVAAGVLSLRTEQPATTDALFLPGSIGKLYTATLVMMLVDEGKLDLDTPIRTYLPDFEVADHHARDTVTPRDLLTHTSGFDGDHFTDTGRGDDALVKYVAGCAELPQIAAPGEIWSYSKRPRQSGHERRACPPQPREHHQRDHGSSEGKGEQLGHESSVAYCGQPAAQAGLRSATRKSESELHGRRSHVDSNRSGSSPTWPASARNSENS